MVTPIRIIFFFHVLLLQTSSFSQLQPVDNYYPARPERRITLPRALHEISGIAVLDSQRVACIQDENGIVFIYNIQKGIIEKEIPFAYNGDYEGIAMVHDTIYVLRSDGAIFEVISGKEETVNYFVTGIPANNNEGLCYDANGHRLLIGCKSKSSDIRYSNKKLVYAFNLLTKKLEPDPVFVLSPSAIRSEAVRAKVITPTRVAGNGKVVPSSVKLNTSEIAIHPLTGELYLLSAADHMLFVFRKGGELQSITRLDEFLFNKPEGIAFFKNGDMLVTNEGQSGTPSLILLRMKRN
jgi:hypothetical protein